MTKSNPTLAERILALPLPEPETLYQADREDITGYTADQMCALLAQAAAMAAEQEGQDAVGYVKVGALELLKKYLDERMPKSMRIYNDRYSDREITVPLYAHTHRAAQEAAAQAPAPDSRDAKDAARWRAFEKALWTGIPGPGHGTKIKVVEVCPMYGEEREVSNITSLIDAAMSAPTDGKGGAHG